MGATAKTTTVSKVHIMGNPDRIPVTARIRAEAGLQTAGIALAMAGMIPRLFP